jgi:hypothetical protein
VAEGEGLEPSRLFTPTVFETGALTHGLAPPGAGPPGIEPDWPVLETSYVAQTRTYASAEWIKFGVRRAGFEPATSQV